MDGSEASADCRQQGSDDVKVGKAGCRYVLKNFLDVPADSITSSNPGRNGSMDGAWLARMPMSPVAAAMLTWTTS